MARRRHLRTVPPRSAGDRQGEHRLGCGPGFALTIPPMRLKQTCALLRLLLPYPDNGQQIGLSRSFGPAACPALSKRLFDEPRAPSGTLGATARVLQKLKF